MAEAGTRGVVVACLAPADLRPDVDPLTGAVRTDGRRAALSASDEAALEHALRAAEALGLDPIAVATGGPGVEPALRQAVAVGAAVLRVPWGGEREAVGPVLLDGADLAGDPHGLAAALVAALRDLGPIRLVVCGDRSPVRGIGAVPALLAHALGAAQALGLVSLQIEGGSIVGDRRLDGGWRERVRVAPPAVCSVEAAGVRLRRASLPATLAAVDATIPVAPGGITPTPPAATIKAGAPQPYRPRTHPVAAPPGDTRDRLLALTGALVAHDPPRVVGPIGAGEAADELLAYLTAHGYRS